MAALAHRTILHDESLLTLLLDAPPERPKRFQNISEFVDQLPARSYAGQPSFYLKV
jgi:hypothetical protein